MNVRRPRASRFRFPSALALASAGLAACASPALPTASVPVAPAPVVPAPPPPSPVVSPATVTVPTTLDAPFRAQAPAPAPEPFFQLPAYKRFKLKNGASVILAEFHDLPLVELHLVLGSGGAANPNGQAGLADLTANLLDEGTKTRSALQIAEQIGELGAALGTTSSWDASVVTLSTIARNFDPALAIWADVIVHPAFAEKELARVRENLLTAVTRRKDSPPTLASLLLSRVLYGERHPYGWPQTGVEETLKKLTIADVRRFYAAHYHPSNATIIVAGDITEAALRPKLEAALADWKPAKVAPLKVPSPTGLAAKRIFFIDKPGAPQSSIRVGFLGARRTDPDYFSILLMNQIFGGSFYRLDMNLRERRQWTYGARSSFDMRKTPGPASAGGEFVAAHTADAVAEILKEMRTMSTTEVTDEELARAKDNFIRSFPARFATRASTAALLGELSIYGLPDSFLADYTKKLQAVTKADVLRVARRYLTGDKVAIVVVGDRASQEAPLRKLAALELRDLDGAPLAAPSAVKEPTGPRGPESKQDSRQDSKQDSKSGD
ncbi:MAG TPA: pitrilysin family protein [Polyangia bacterium]|jgi:zinc protease